MSFLQNQDLFLQECSHSSGIQSHSSGFWSHSSGFQWIPVEFGHSCRNVGGIEKWGASRSGGHREVLVPEEYHNFADIFSKVKAKKIALHWPYDLKINLEEGTSPPIVPMYPLSQPSSKFSITSLMTISEPDLSARVPPPMAL